MDNSEIEVYIRFWLGNLSESDVTPEDFDKIIELTRVQYPTATDCQYLYYTTVNLLSWLIRQDSQGSSSSTVAGAVTKRKEKRNNTEIEVTYSDGGESVTSASWETLLDDLESNPDSIGCIPFQASTSGTGSVIIGSSKDRFETASPWRQNQLSPKRKSWYD